MIRFTPVTGPYRQAIDLIAAGWHLLVDSTPAAESTPRPEETSEAAPAPNGDFMFWLPVANGCVVVGLIDVCDHGWTTLPLTGSLQNILSYLDQIYSPNGAAAPLENLDEFGRRFLSLATSLDEELPEYARNSFSGQLILLHPDGEIEVMNMATLGPWRRLPQADWQLVRLAGNSGIQFCETRSEAEAGDAPQPPLAMEAADRFRVEAGTEIYFATDGVYESGRRGLPGRMRWDRGVREVLDQLPEFEDMDVCAELICEDLRSDYPPGSQIAWPEDDTTQLLIRRL